MLVILILAISVLFQFLSAFFAFRLIKATGKTRSWILISAALFLMGIRRTITLFHLIFISGSNKSDPESEIVALFISFLMFLGVIMIRPLFLERRQNEEALQNSEDKFKYVFKHSILGNSITLPSGEIFVNDALYKMLGYSPEELQNKKWQDITYPGDIELTQQALDTIFSGKKESARFIKRYIHKNGSVIWGDVGTSVRRDEEGKPLYFITFINDITERKRAEEALRQSEEQFRTLFMSMREGFYLSEIIYDDNGNPCDYRYLEVNPKFEEMIGLSREDIVGKRYKEIVPVDTTQWLNYYFLVATTGKPGTYEFYSNEYNTYYETYSYMPAKGQVSVIIKNITDRKQAEKALKESQQRFKNIVDASPMGIHLYELMDDSKLIFIGANPAADRILKVDHTIFVGKTIEEAFPGLIGTEIPARYKEAAHYGSLWRTNQIEYNIDMIIGAFEVVAFQTEPGRMAAIFKDVTEQKQIEQELQKYREQLEELVKQRTIELDKGRNMLRTLIDSLPDEIYAKDNESRFIMANSHVLRTFGRTSFNDILGKTDFDFLPNEEAMKAYSKEHSVLQHDGQMINYEEQIMDTNGKMRWLSVTKVPMRDKEGRIIGLVGINSDVTEFKHIEENLQKAKEAAETANRAKSTFLSSMSHEIRTPMNAILGFSELMLHDKNLTEDQTNWIKTINQSGEHLLALINDILEISRIEAGRITYNPSSFDLYELLHDLQSMFKIKTDTKHLTLLFEYSDDLPRFVITDEGKLRQILINIIGNAVKFTQEGCIVIRIHSEAEIDGKISLTIETEDTGPGIAEKDMEVLFQMFGQTETGIKEGGTGLGLAISQQYAKIMGGYITVKSKSAKGTCFIIKIDVLPGNKLTEKNHIKGRVVRLKSGESNKVLVVDDRGNNRKLLKDMLLSVGFIVEEAKNGLEAIKKYKTWQPDIILMDMRMPVMDGFEAIRSIRSMNSKEDKKIPIIAVTAGAFTEDEVKALESGADMYLRKPFKENELFESIKICLNSQYVYNEV